MGFITDLLKDIPLSAVIREKLIEVEKKLSVFEQQNKQLQTNLNQATKEIQSLKELNQELQRTKDQDTKKIDNVTEQILQQFFDARNDLPLSFIESSLSLDTNIVKYHFDILREHEYIGLASVGLDLPGCSGPALYSISPKGRKYVMEIIRNRNNS
ncbi:MAG: hypothetical protein ACUZ8N_04225 [Candidatus Scalindua sp.]